MIELGMIGEDEDSKTYQDMIIANKGEEFWPTARYTTDICCVHQRKKLQQNFYANLLDVERK